MTFSQNLNFIPIHSEIILTKAETLNENEIHLGRETLDKSSLLQRKIVPRWVFPFIYLMCNAFDKIFFVVQDLYVFYPLYKHQACIFYCQHPETEYFTITYPTQKLWASRTDNKMMYTIVWVYIYINCTPLCGNKTNTVFACYIHPGLISKLLQLISIFNTNSH